MHFNTALHYACLFEKINIIEVKYNFLYNFKIIYNKLIKNYRYF